MSEATNYTGSSDYATHPSSPAGRPSRPSKKIHNFGKRSNSIRRNPNAPVIKSNWLYKQDSTGMKLWKKRWFVLSDMCLFYYRDEKEEGILGSILLPSFHISMLSVDDHINRKYAFKATHPNMRTYYFCTDAAKEMESWMKVMTDAALVHSEPPKSRLDRLKVEQCGPQEVNHVGNHRPLTRPEIQNNERNREADRSPREADRSPREADRSPREADRSPREADRSPREADRSPREADRSPREADHNHEADRERQLAAEESRKQRDAERYGFQSGGAERERPLTKINSIKLQPAQAAALTANISSPSPAARTAQPDAGPRGAPQVNGSGEQSPRDGSAPPTQEPGRSLQRTSSMQQLEQWVRTQRVRNQDDDTRSIMSYQTLPRNMPSHRAPVLPHYGDGYRTLPRNSMAQRDSICSMTPSMYEQALGPGPGDKRRSMRDDTMWQLFEWQQRQAYVRPPGAPGPYGTLPSPKTMINLSEHAGHSIPPSPSHGSLAMYGGYSPLRSYHPGARSEVSSPVYRGDMSIDRRNRTHLTKYAYPPDRRSMPVGLPVQTITAQTLQGKTMSPEDYREHAYMCRPEEVDTDTKLSRLCEQDKVVRTQEDKLQQLHREKHTLETALLSASQEIELGSENPAAMQSVIQQRDVLQSGLLSTCRELARVKTELERSWREYDRLEGDVTLAKNSLLEQLEALGSPQTEPPSQQHVHIQRELWRIQDVMEALSKSRAQRRAQRSADGLDPDSLAPGSSHFSSKNKSEGPDYRLYKSEPELTTVAEVDESGEDRSEHTDRDPSGSKGMSYPVGIVPPRTKSPMPESSTIASYVTLRKGRKPDPRTERPRSAVEQLCAAETSRSRMSVEEQLERIRRHQQGALREKKKGLNLLDAHSPTRSPSLTKDNPFRSMQAHNRRREEAMSCDIQALEASLRRQEVGRDQETPAEEIARLKEAVQDDHFNMDRELSVPDKVLIPERYVEAEPEVVLSPQEEAEKQKKVDRIKALITKNSMQNAVLSGELSRDEGGEEDSPGLEQDKIINISYELAAEASKRSKLVAAQAVASVKTYT